MSFSTDMAKLVSDQIAKFVTLNRHQLAGHVANLDFWMAQVCHCLDVLDGYEKRSRQLKTAQGRHVAQWHTVDFALDDPCCTQAAPAPPRRVPDDELKDARRVLCEATLRFLRRCSSEALIDGPALRKACEDAGIEFQETDFVSRA